MGSYSEFPSRSVFIWPNQPENMVWIPGGEFWMGGPSKSQSLQAANDVRPGLTVCRGLVEGFSDAEPHLRVHVDGFWMDKTVVTNEEFAKFTEATGYITVAELQPTAEQFPGAPPENLVAGSACFTPPNHPVSLDNYLEWWSYILRQIAGPLLLLYYLAVSDGRAADSVAVPPEGSAPETIVSQARLSLAEARKTQSDPKTAGADCSPKCRR
jgi:Sulfatase-modifying factor enzyme 1